LTTTRLQQWESKSYEHTKRLPQQVWPSYRPADEATEREKLIAANQAFAAALKQALRSGKETPAGVLATVSPKRGKNGTLAL